jgi:hypothetical protein
MRCIKPTLLFLTLFLFISLYNQAHAFTVTLPVDTRIKDGYQAIFGDYWISTSGTDIIITSWMVSDWLTYTVDGSGTQQVYRGEPSEVYVDGVKKDSGDGWSYTSNLVTVTGASSTVSMFFGSATPPSSPLGSIPGSLGVVFQVSMAGFPVEGCMIEIYELPYDYYQGSLYTDSRGKAERDLSIGEYRWKAECQGMTQNDTFFHDDYQVINVDFIGKPKVSMKGAILSVLIALIVIAVGTWAILKVKR